ncbi:hypothetical protein MUA04_01995 [Enterobacteriaceae bacterium H11S18]|nr:hypothetical protein [Dryocola clanedunensis]MCT4708987.1 hypothetical protein [Dryocola clanedunensis]
MNREEMHCDVV